MFEYDGKYSCNGLDQNKLQNSLFHPPEEYSKILYNYQTYLSV